MIKAVALDDEPLALKVIQGLCNQSGAVQLARSFTNQQEAKAFLSENKVDLLFLDIQMPSENGLMFYKKLNSSIPVIFTTAYSNYAVDGFNLDAVDYLLKPISQERFNAAIEKVKRLIIQRSVSKEAFIQLKADHQIHKIPLNEVRYIQSDDDYIKIHFLGDRPKLFRITLKEIQAMLPENDFVRIHRSFILPKRLITKIGGKTAYLNELEFPIGSNYEDAVKEKFNQNI